MKPVKFTIPIAPITKKNHSQVIRNKKTGTVMVIPSRQYLQYEKDAMWFLPHTDTIEEPVNVKAVFYMQTRRRVDLTNLLQALLDLLVKYGIIADDNSKIVFSVDGSYVDYDKENPRTEVEIYGKDDTMRSNS